MEKFVVGLADDMQNIHDMVERFVTGYDELIQLEHFYFTSEVEDLGINSRILTRMIERGIIERVARGVYISVDKRERR